MLYLYIFKFWRHHTFFTISVTWDRCEPLQHCTLTLLLCFEGSWSAIFFLYSHVACGRKQPYSTTIKPPFSLSSPQRPIQALLILYFLEAFFFWGITYILSLLHKAESATLLRENTSRSVSSVLRGCLSLELLGPSLSFSWYFPDDSDSLFIFYQNV